MQLWLLMPLPNCMCYMQLGWEDGYEGNVLATEPLFQSKVQHTLTHTAHS